MTLTYRDRDGAVTSRPFDPYAGVYLKNAAWYAVGHCHLRGDVRVFRLDRVVDAEPEGARFACPADFDGLAHVHRSFALLPERWSAELVLDASPEAARRWVAPLFAVVAEEEGEVIVRCSATDIDWLARTLVALPFAFRVRRPPQLVEALAAVRERIDRAIAASGSAQVSAPKAASLASDDRHP